MRRRLIAMIVLLALSLLGVGAATPAGAQTVTSIDVVSATLVAKGAALDVNLTVTCEAGASGSAGATVTQRSGNVIMQGSGSATFVCTGEPQTVTVRVVAAAGGAPFRSGDAVVSAYVIACSFECQSASTNETVRVGR